MLKFDEATHTYTVNGKVLRSATELIKEYFPFEEDEIAVYLSGKTGFTPEYIKSVWAGERNKAVLKGNHYHKVAEDLFHEKVVPDDRMVAQIRQFFKDHKFLSKVKAEWQVYSEQLGIAGTVDLVLKDEKRDKYYIFDWKTSRQIKNYSPFTGKKPLNHLMDCNYVHYSLQLSLYRYLLEEIYKCDVEYAGIVQLKEDGYRLIPTMYLKKEVETILGIT